MDTLAVCLHLHVCTLFGAYPGEICRLEPFFARPGEQSSIVPDGVARSEANPLRNGAVLLLRLGELLLRAERLVALSSW